MLRRLVTPLLPILVAAGLLAGCGDDSPKDENLARLEAVEVKDSKDGKPQLEFVQPLAVTKTVRTILEEGDGAEVTEGSTAVFDFVFVNGRDGTEVSASYGIEQAKIVVNDRLLAGVRIALLGLKAGSRALIAIAPEDGFAGQGDDPESGVKADDTLLLVIELHDVRPTRAEGKAVAPVDGLPTVVLDDSGKPTITVPKTAPPTKLVSQLLIEGEGPEVEAEQTITVHYTGVLWDGGTEFDSSWTGEPASFPIGTGGVIAGWDKGLVGKTVGSQVLLVVPPADGYGDEGSGSIPGGATLVFVVDILDAR